MSQDLFNFFGMDIIISPTKLVQKVKLERTFPCNDARFTEMNEWLLQRFGTKAVSIINSGAAYVFGNKIIMRPEDAVRITNLSL